MATKEVLVLSRCNTSFGLDLFKKLASSNKGGNVFFSPYSIFSALAMTSLGAKNETLNQLRKALKLEDIPEEQAHKLFSEMNEAVLENCDKCVLHIANRLYGEKSYDLKEEFLEDCRKFYEADLAAVDFKNNAPEHEKEINDWVASQTVDKIKDLIPIGTLNNSTKLVLINAIYFKGDWNKKFQVLQTEECDFHVDADNLVKVQMMHMKRAKLNYGFNNKLNCQILELPYFGKSVSMFILLPNLENTTLEELENSLCSEDLDELHVMEKEINVWLPRFKIEQDFELSDVLGKMGATDLFVNGNADLSGMAENKDISLSKVIHKAFIEVNEDGSEAAAATAVVLLGCGMGKRTEFRANHPFLFYLKNQSTGSVLFFGRVLRP